MAALDAAGGGITCVTVDFSLVPGRSAGGARSGLGAKAAAAMQAVGKFARKLVQQPA